MSAFLIRLRTNWFRNLSAILQVALAVAMVTAVLASVLPALRGPEEKEPLFEVRYGRRDSSGMSFSLVFYLEDVAYLQETAETIEGVSILQNESLGIIRVGDDRYAVSGVIKASPSYERMRGIEMVSGTFFTEEEVPDVTPQVAVLSDRLAEMLFDDGNPIGRTINLRPQEEQSILLGFLPRGTNLDVQSLQGQPGTDLTIIGVFKANDDGLLSVGSEHLIIPAARNRQPVRVPIRPPQISDSARIVIVDTLPPPTPQRIAYGTILVKPRAGMERQAEEEIRSLLESRLKGRPEAQRFADTENVGIMIDPVRDLSERLRDVRLRQGVITGALALAALIVAGFAIFTTTMANLTQRIRSIGLARSIGATRGHVMRDVIFEATVLSGLGGIFGVLIAYPINQTLLEPLKSTLVQGEVTLTGILVAGLIGVLIAVVIGALSAIVPAWTVSRLAPAEAWREGPV